MPPFNVLGDSDLASVINYLRANFAPAAPKVTPEQVAAQRARL
jgi:mono/diheme cytochrome c family protein